MLALGCGVVAAAAVAGAVGSYSRLLRAAGGAWQRGEAATQQGYIFTNVIGAHLNNLWNSQKHVRVLGNIDVEEPARVWRQDWEVLETAL